MIDKIKNICSHYSDQEFKDSPLKVTEIRDRFDIKLMVVGHFNAGKSSLLNALMGRAGFLKEAQEPQTSIATELIYDDTESAFAYDREGKKYAYCSEVEYSPSRYDHLEFRLNAPALREIGDFTIVDTPGFDAGIESHTKALANYIGTGSAYLVVIDQDKGGIDQTTLDFIQEISNYSSQIAVLINKCDNITAENAESIADSAKFTLLSNGFPYKVFTTSRNDDDISDKLVAIISEFNAQAAFDKVIRGQIKAELINIEKVLSLAQKRIYLDTFDVDSDIAAYTKMENDLADSFANKRKEVKDKQDEEVKEIINRIENALILRAGYVVEALLSGNTVAAEAIIVETIRPIMLESMKDISTRQIDEVAETLDFTGLLNKSEQADLMDVAVNLASNLKGLISQRIFDINTSTETSTETESNGNGKNVYRTIAGIAAIATDVVAPWLEVIIILLPDIVTLLRGIFGESNADIVKRRFVNNIVPQIINKLDPQVRANVEFTSKIVLDEYEKMLNKKISSIKNTITEAEDKKNKKIEEFNQYKANIVNDISVAQSLIKELE